MRRTHRTLAAVACGAGLLLGALVALVGPWIAGVAAAAICFGGLLLFNLELSFALWTSFALFEAVPALDAAVKGTAVLLFVASLGAVAHRPARLVGLLGRHGRLVTAILLLLVWITLSTAWSERPETGAFLLQWHLAAAVFFMTALLVTDGRHLRWVMLAVVAGTALTAAVGIGGTPVAPGIPFLEAGVGNEDRLQGGVDDPNFFAVLLVVAMALASGLLLVSRRALVRLGLGLAIVLLTVGVVATQSRGGAVALVAAAVCGLIVFRGRRLRLLGAVAVLLGVVALAFSQAPEALDRVTTTEGGGTGRTDIWKVAVAMAKDHPLTGVGIGNFGVHSPRYVDELGPLERADLVAEKRLVVHSAYLELLAETGIVGLALFLMVVAGGLAAVWRAARRFDELGETSLGVLASSVVVATVAFLAGAVFVSNGFDERLWLLLALGPAMIAMAERRSVPVPTAPAAAPSAGTASPVLLQR